MLPFMLIWEAHQNLGRGGGSGGGSPSCRRKLTAGGLFRHNIIITEYFLYSSDQAGMIQSNHVADVHSVPPPAPAWGNPIPRVGRTISAVSRVSVAANGSVVNCRR